jgi:hypothetical protein
MSDDLRYDDSGGQREKRSVRATFWDIVCSAQPYVFLFFVFEVLFIVLGIIALPFVRPGTASYIVLQFDFILLGVITPPTIFILWYCHKRP